MIAPVRRLAIAAVLTLALPLAAVQAAPPPAPASASAAAPVDINEASEQQLTAIPGVGESLAKRIVDFRKENGPYRQVDDLLKVKGIGEKSLEKLRAYVKVGKVAN